MSTSDFPVVDYTPAVVETQEIEVEPETFTITVTRETADKLATLLGNSVISESMHPDLWRVYSGLSKHVPYDARAYRLSPTTTIRIEKRGSSNW